MKTITAKMTFIGLVALSALAFRSSKPIDLQQKAKAEHKNIVVYFAGSDWCVPCHQFRESFLKSTKVDSVLDKHFVYYLADFPQRTKLEASVEALNDNLAEKLNPEGVFPRLVIADENYKIKAVITKSMDYTEAYNTLIANQK